MAYLQILFKGFGLGILYHSRTTFFNHFTKVHESNIISKPLCLAQDIVYQHYGKIITQLLKLLSHFSAEWEAKFTAIFPEVAIIARPGFFRKYCPAHLALPAWKGQNLN